uniref:Uncharacterized protein n=1 Tax=Wuchereria bancrofti TaxID=6293 RepID=A0A1I8EYX8_WUCBA
KGTTNNELLNGAPEASVGPVSPVRPITSIESFSPVSSSKNTSWCQHIKEINNNNNEHSKLFDGYRPVTPIQPFDILPVSIPRIEIDKAINNNALPSRRNHCSDTFYEHSSRSDDSRGFVSQSSHSGSGGRVPSVNSIFVANSIGPLKKVIKESRWISVHDGRPVGPYVRTVTYVPKYSDDEYVLNACNDRNYHCNNKYNLQQK